MRIDGFRPLPQQPRNRRAGRVRPGEEDGPALIEAAPAVPSEAEFERLRRNPTDIRVLSPLASPGGRVLEALTHYTRISMLLDERPVRHYIDIYA
ncbi:MAG TPA: hypothetical protein VKY70_08780 [Pseudomonas sp.]|jgi:hypothetical protein|nr:hypothetical protein [Pseudomonas sp.]